jgi:2-oxoglutarate dehydrogenase E1 component
MKDLSHIFNAHPSYIESIYSTYKNNPSDVDQEWRLFFEGFDFASTTGESAGIEAPSGDFASYQKEIGVMSIIHGYRQRGHLISDTNPIRQRKNRAPHLELKDYNLAESDLNSVFKAGEEIGMKDATLQQILDRLKTIYCGHIGIEYSHIENREKRMWLRSKLEGRNLNIDFGLTMQKKKRILEKLNGATIFEKFLHTKFVGQKRFSLEGGETTIAALDAIINKGATDKVEEVIIGMAHRGRLNVLANTLGKTYENIFNEFEGNTNQDQSFGDGDVKYHLGYSSQVTTPEGNAVHLKLVPNPSHLEAVNPVVEGFSRAKADLLYGSDYDKILPITIHGDAAAAGQGVVYETVQMSQLEGYYTGGTIHFVINNQVGFTTDFEDARSSTYCTAAAALVQAPVFHVNGDNPEAVVFASELATEYRQLFNNDVFIDMVCYRRHGHNEGDDPKFTQPHMYDIITDHPDPRSIYAKTLLERGEADGKLADDLEAKFWNILQERLDGVKQKSLPYKYQEPEKAWKALTRTYEVSDLFGKKVATGIDKKLATKLVDHLMSTPKDFTIMSKVNRLQKSKQDLITAGNIDWGWAELLAYGSILAEGKNVRMSGQDVKRGTFSHRHAIFRDDKTYEAYNRLSGLGGQFMIYNSLLSEFAVLGFEYGYSLSSPDHLVVWEAQFGDFANGAQTMIDQFISSSESKWQRMSGLMMLLPHGMEGQGPEHSSARLERFLALCANFNMFVVNVTTPANFFHLIRRQLALPYRKPCVVMSPKSLLRHPSCISKLSEIESATEFQPIIADTEVAPKDAKRLLFCSGKVYYDLAEYRKANNIKDTAIYRLEQIYPLDVNAVTTIMKSHSKAEAFWVQEESANNGSWTFLMQYLRKEPIDLIARKASASPATGFKKVHDQQQEDLMKQAFGLTK